MKIRIAENIDDTFLKSEWERMEQEGDVFPQNTYHWCSTWWKYFGGKRKLHIVMALDDEEKTLGIAPLCIERHFGVPVLRSFPIHFGDFYTFIVQQDKFSEVVYETLLRYINYRKQWRWVRIEKVREEDRLVIALVRNEYPMQKMAGCLMIDYSGLDWNGYLSRLKWKRRQNIRKKFKEIHNNYHPTLEIVTSLKDYSPLFGEMVTIHEKRWKDDNTVSKGPRQIACWREAIEGQFLKGNMWYCRLSLNGKTAAYHLGFMHRHVFYDWHMSHDPEYARYHVGVMTLAFMIQQFIDKQIEKINLMAGEYDWKRAWSPSREAETIWLFTSPSHSLASTLLNWYHHRMRNILKAAYHKMMQVRTLRVVSRGVILVRQKLAGLR